MNNKHVRNTPVTNNTTTINNESTNILLNLLANSTLPQAIQITQSAASHSFTFSDKPDSKRNPVSDGSQCNDKSNCQCCSCVKARNTCTNCLPLRHDHCKNNKHSWIRSLMSNKTTINDETTNVPSNQLASSTPQIQVDLLNQTLSLPSLFLTIISITLD